MKKFLVIQPAFIGDAILATSVLEKLYEYYPTGQIDILVRSGNESLFDKHPFLHEVIIWDKTRQKYRNLVALVPKLRRAKYDLVVNLHRFATSGFLTVFSGGKRTVGFKKNPFSILFSQRFPHHFGPKESPMHEIERYQLLVEKETDSKALRHKLHPSGADSEKTLVTGRYITISPGTVWFTKKWPTEKWVAFMDRVGEDTTIFLLGGKGERELCDRLKSLTTHQKVCSKAGEFSFLQSAALMRGAKMNFANDSAPLHLASAVNAPVTGVFCSTAPIFGFVPLSDDSAIVETGHELACRPCGLHGRRACPLGHFKCADIQIEKLLDRIR